MTRELTPSGLKWVGNELAAVSGELQCVQEEIDRLAVRKARLEGVRDSLSPVGALLGVAELHNLVPPVRVHKAYGGRGFLVDWVKDVLRAAAPRCFDTRTLVLLAEERFNLTFQTYVERDQFRKNSLGRALRLLLAQGLVERLHDPKKAPAPGVWRWKSPMSGFEELQQVKVEERGTA